MVKNNKSSSPLTIIILNHNVRPFLTHCLKSILKDPQSKNWKFIVVDNASTDDSIKHLKKYFPQKVKLITSDKNLGFSAGNNLAVKHINTPYTLFLNPDTLVPQDTLPYMLKFMTQHPQVGAATCRVELPDGQLDDSCHRGFPTPWNAFCHFSGLAKIFPKTKLFTGYSLGYLLKEQQPQKHQPSPHPVDSINGAFFLLRTKIGQQLHWWDTDYFWYGEDLDFCYRIKNLGHQIYYVPQVKIIHYKGASSGLYSPAKPPQGQHTLNFTNMSDPLGVNEIRPIPSQATRLRSARASTQAMRTFYRKHYANKYPHWLTWLVLTAINLIQSHRLRKYS